MPIQRLAEEFHAKYPWITIQYYEVGYSGGNSIEQWVRSGGVDLFRTSREAMGWIDDGLLKPMDDIQLDDFSEIRSDYYSGLWDALALEGVQYGVPAGMDVYVAYVNTQQAQALGVDLPKDDWDKIEFYEFVKSLNGWNPSGMSESSLIGFCTDPQSMDPLVYVYSHGGTIVDSIEDPRQATLDDPLTIEATQSYADLFNRDQLSPTREVARKLFPRGGVYEAEIRGQCGAWFNWFSERGGSGTGMLSWQNQWKMYNLPHDNRDMAMGNVEGYYLAGSSDYPEEALVFIRWLSDRWDAAGTLIPPRISQQQDDGYRESLGKELTAVVDAFPKEVIFLPGSYTPELEAVGTAYFKAVGQIIAEDVPADGVLKEAQDSLRSAFE